MSRVSIDLIAKPTEQDRQAILKPLLAYNDTQTDEEETRHLAILLRDEGGEAKGGLWGECYWDWLFVALLFVPEELRGQGLGAKLLRQAEEWARKEGCTGVWLDTFSFQAPGFYEKHGYSVFGTLEGYPREHQRYFLRKPV